MKMDESHRYPAAIKDNYFCLYSIWAHTNTTYDFDVYRKSASLNDELITIKAVTIDQDNKVVDMYSFSD